MNNHEHMIVTMPMQINEEEYVLLLGLPNQSLERIKNHDPSMIPMKEIVAPKPFNKLRLSKIAITYCSPEDLKQVEQMVKDHANQLDIAKLLTRGWTYRPDLGDSDEPPVDLLRGTFNPSDN